VRQIAATNEMSAKNKPSKIPALVAVLSALAVGLPFLNKPIHIDDPFVLAVAEQICRDPLRPFSASFNWFHDPDPMFSIATNPPFLSYWMAPVLAIFGPSEIALHLAMLPFLILMALAAVALSRRFAQGSIWPILFIMLSPAVVVSSNVMRDVPGAALATAAVALVVAGTDRDRWSHVLLGSIFAGLAVVTKYSALIMVPVLALYPILQRKPRYLAGLLAGLAILGLWYLQNYLVHGQIHFFVMRSKEQANLNLMNMLAAALVITGASFLVVPGLLAQAVRRGHWLALLGAAIIAAGTLLFLKKHYPGQTNFQYCLWAVLGAVLVSWVFVAGLFGVGSEKTNPTRNSDSPFSLASRLSPLTSLDSLFLVAWLVGPYLCGVLFVEFPAVRHILPGVAPIALLAVRYTQQGGTGILPVKNHGQNAHATTGPPNRWIGAFLGVGLVLQAIIAFWTAAADYQYADTYRRFAREAAETLKAKVAPGNRIWFAGHWGWQHYALKAGFRQIAEHGPDFPKTGDLVLTADIVHKGNLPPGLQDRLEQILPEKRYPARLNVVTMDWVYASFYATFGTTSPQYYIRGQDYEVFRVFRVKP